MICSVWERDEIRQESKSEAIMVRRDELNRGCHLELQGGWDALDKLSRPYTATWWTVVQQRDNPP